MSSKSLNKILNTIILVICAQTSCIFNAVKLAPKWKRGWFEGTNGWTIHVISLVNVLSHRVDAVLYNT